jgi:hypothetical protein
VTFLIDGYNLMHAVGYAHRAMSAGELARGRTRLLDWIADLRGGRPDAVTVVFDAVGGRASPDSAHRGVLVRYAHRQTADDAIERLVAAEKHPRQLAVVSNDGRIQDAARRRRCAVYSCDAFVDWLLAPAAVPEPRKEEPGGSRPPLAAPTPSADEMAAWLAAFSQPPKRKPR